MTLEPEPPASFDEVLRFARKPPPIDTLTAVLLGGAIGIVGGLGAAMGPRIVRSGLKPLHLALLAVVLALLSIPFVIRRVRRRGGVPPVEVHPTHLCLPRPGLSRRVDRVPYEALLALDVAGSERSRRLIIGTTERVYVYPAKSFDAPNAWLLLRAAVRERVAGHPDGPHLLMRMAEREALGRLAWSEAPWVTYTLLALMCALYLLEWRLDAVGTVGLVRMGANAPVLVREGQWYRLFTANFLHGGFIHLYMNGVAFASLGALLERVLGPSRYVFIWGVSALGGALASTLLARASLSVGASTALFGLLGALAAMQLRGRGGLPVGFGQTRRWWIVILTINGLLPVLVPQIDWAAHAGGFVTGLGVTLVLCRTPEQLRRDHRPHPLFTAAAWVLCLMFAAAVVPALRRVQGAPAALDETRVLVAALSTQEDKDLAARALNQLAWEIATRKEADAEELAVAERAARRATELNRTRFQNQYLDTLATVLYRQKKLDRAIAIERDVLRDEPSATIASQLARFLRARLEHSSPVVRGSEIPFPTPRARIVHDGGTRMLELDFERALPKSGTLYVLAQSESGRLLGLLSVDLGAAPVGPSVRIEATFPSLVDDASLRSAMLDLERAGEERLPHAELWPMDPDIATLP